MTVKISSLPRSMQKLVIHFVELGKSAQLLRGPITPRPGPILPIVEADTAKEEMKSVFAVSAMIKDSIMKIII